MCQRKVFLSSHEKALFFECLPSEICIVEMSEQPQYNPLMQTASQEEGEVSNVSLETVEIPDDWVFIFFFETDEAFARIDAYSARWPLYMSNAAKLALAEGDLVDIRCGGSGELYATGKLKWQGPRSMSVRILSNLCREFAKQKGLESDESDSDDLEHFYSE